MANPYFRSKAPLFAQWDKEGGLLRMLANNSPHGIVSKAIYDSAAGDSAQQAWDVKTTAGENTKRAGLDATNYINSLKLANKQQDLANDELRGQISLAQMGNQKNSDTMGILGTLFAGGGMIGNAAKQYQQDKDMEEALTPWKKMLAMAKINGLSSSPTDLLSLLSSSR